MQIDPSFLAVIAAAADSPYSRLLASALPSLASQHKMLLRGYETAQMATAKMARELADITGR